MAEYIYETDITEVDTQIIVQQCNCSSKTAKGLSEDIKKAFPYADFYSKRKMPSVPGTIEVKGGKGIGRFVCAFFSQVFPGGPGKEKDTEKDRILYFKNCLNALKKVKNLREVAFPYKIGCSLAKGNWKTYSGMIEKFALENENIQVYIICKDPKPEEPQIDKSFLVWVSKRITEEEDLLSKYPDFFSDMHLAYHEYLHNVLEEDDPIAIKEEIPDDQENEKVLIRWEDATLEEYTEKNIPEGWEGFFNEQLNVDFGSIHELSKYLFAELQKGDIYPELDKIYNIFNMVRPEDIKVVIIGQDPYINPGEATGVAFSVPEGIDVPPSLKNIYKELKDDGFAISDPANGDLTKWVEQGVFLINTALTVRAHESGSHSKKWNDQKTGDFSGSLMRWLSENCGPLVVIMWGKHAQNFSKYFGEPHKQLIGVHPSPLSAHRGFFGSKPFSKANKMLENLGHDLIDWSL